MNNYSNCKEENCIHEGKTFTNAYVVLVTLPTCGKNQQTGLSGQQLTTQSKTVKNKNSNDT